MIKGRNSGASRKKHFPTGNKDGSSIVSVIVSFSILMIGLAMFTSVVYASGNIIRKNETFRHESEAAIEAYYEDNDASGELISGQLRLVPEDQPANGITVTGELKKFSHEGYGIYYFR